MLALEVLVTPVPLSLAWCWVSHMQAGPLPRGACLCWLLKRWWLPQGLQAPSLL